MFCCVCLEEDEREYTDDDLGGFELVRFDIYFQDFLLELYNLSGVTQINMSSP